MDDIPDKHVEEFGEQIAKEFHLLKSDLFELRLMWRSYRELFGKNKERVELLNSISGSFAQTIEISLWESVLIRLRRFNDEGASRIKRRPLSLGLLREISKQTNDQELRKLIQEAKTKAAFAKNWSDKRIAHSDYDYRMGSVKLESASRQKVTDAIDAIAAVIKRIGSERLDTHYVTHPVSALKDETFVLKLLLDGKKGWDAKPDLARSLIKNGDYEAYKEVYKYPSWLDRTPDEHD
ncbi:hypothetical protein SAMN04488001_2280 [Litoreibacter albidus]|uniref:HEPN AbiU2-like domain-containing protein n=2 Tax=Litoreibacter albidus TaxID=670155 RepID=A0A1H2YB81_9RHOB|nr:hypothetical protein SAMN04488001_2280 [Litoreibacter albidus]